MEDGCEASLSSAGVSNSVKIGPPPEAVLGNVKVWDLRNYRQVIIPSGLERIEEYWFWGAEIESVMIPASVREICAEAFYRCKKLKEVIFEEGSRLEKIEHGCFYSTRIKRIVVPNSVTAIQEGTF